MGGKLAAFQIQNLIVAYKERFDKDSFIKNLLLDNLLLVDIYNRAKKLHIEADVRRVVMILEMPQEKDHSSRAVSYTHLLFYRRNSQESGQTKLSVRICSTIKE